MLNLPDNLRPREIVHELREYQKSHKLPPYFISWCMDALARSKNGYIVYSTAEHPAGAHGPVSTSSAEYFANRLEAENAFNREKSRPGVVLAHVIESDQAPWKLVNTVRHGLERASRGWRATHRLTSGDLCAERLSRITWTVRVGSTRSSISRRPRTVCGSRRRWRSAAQGCRGAAPMRLSDLTSTRMPRHCRGS